MYLDELLASGVMDGWRLTDWPERNVVALERMLKAKRLRAVVTYDATPGTVEHDGRPVTLYVGTLTVTVTPGRGVYRFYVRAAERADVSPAPYRPDRWMAQRPDASGARYRDGYRSDGRIIWRTDGHALWWSSVNVPPADADPNDRTHPVPFLQRTAGMSDPVVTFSARASALARVMPAGPFRLDATPDGVTIVTDASSVPAPTPGASGTCTVWMAGPLVRRVLGGLDKRADASVTLLGGQNCIWISSGPYDALISGVIPW